MLSSSSGLRGSLQRLQLEYVDVVFANRPDNNTPMEGKCFSQWKWLYRKFKELFQQVNNAETNMAVEDRLVLHTLDMLICILLITLKKSKNV